MDIKKEFSKVICNGDDQVTVKKLLDELVPEHTKQKIIERFWARNDKTFSAVLDGLKNGYAKRAYRRGWNGKGMFIYYTPQIEAPADQDEADLLGIEAGEPVIVHSMLGIKTAQNTLGPWRPTNPDLFANDWVIEY